MHNMSTNIILTGGLGSAQSRYGELMRCDACCGLRFLDRSDSTALSEEVWKPIIEGKYFNGYYQIKTLRPKRGAGRRERKQAGHDELGCSASELL